MRMSFACIREGDQLLSRQVKITRPYKKQLTTLKEAADEMNRFGAQCKLPIVRE
jgi:hypothetical protein